MKSQVNTEKPNDGRKYHIGDKVDFTDDSGKQVPGIVHAVRYQQGKYELVGTQHEIADDPTSPVVPGSGHMELVEGTQGLRHSFEYIMVHEQEHRDWWETEQANVKHIEAGDHHKIKLLPHLKQHVRVFEEDA